MQEDFELLQEIKKGNCQAMELIIKKYYKNIFAFVYRSIGQYHTSMDIAQEIFIKVVKSLPGIDNDSNIKNWIFKVAVNTVKDYYRSSSYKSYCSVLEVDSKISDNNDRIIDLISKLEDRQMIKNCLPSLNEYQREAIILRFYHDMKIADIAKVTETGESTVKSRIREGLQKMKKLMEKGGEYSDGERATEK